MQSYIKENFGDILGSFLNDERKPSKNIMRTAGLKFRDCFKEGEMEYFFLQKNSRTEIRYFFVKARIIDTFLC